MKIGIKVGDLMTRNFVSVVPGTPVSKCAKIMIAKNVGSLVVKEDDNLHGVVTEGDIIKAIASNKNLGKIKAGHIMSKRTLTISPSDDVYSALIKMQGKKIRWLPVTTGKNVIGLLTLRDILKVEPSLFEMVASGFSSIKEESEKLKAISLRKKSRAETSGEIWAKEGECENCEAYGLLYNIDGQLICEDCKDDL